MRLIDADALMKEFAKFVAPSNRSDFVQPPNWNDAVSLVDSAPTIEPKKGKWLLTEVSPQEIAQRLRTMKCSCCGEYQTAPYLGTFKVFNFCPNCGAKMERSESYGT